VDSHFGLGDILANAITHGVGAALAVAGAVYLVAVCARGDAWHIVGCAVFVFTWSWSICAPRFITPSSGPGRGTCFIYSITRPSIF
jgi:hypothetical protein